MDRLTYFFVSSGVDALAGSYCILWDMEYTLDKGEISVSDWQQKALEVKLTKLISRAIKVREQLREAISDD